MIDHSKIGMVGNSIALGQGRYFDYQNPLPEMVDIRDIARSLSNICRFAGHCSFYSVAEHSYHCLCLAMRETDDTEAQLAVLLHDAPEAYIGDVAKPLKVLLPDYLKMEKRITDVVNKALGLNTEKHKDLIKHVDLIMLKREANHMFSSGDERLAWSGFDQIPKTELEIRGWTPSYAEFRFRRAYSNLTGNRGFQ